MATSSASDDAAQQRVEHTGKNFAKTYVTVMSIPVVGGNGKIQNRMLCFEKPPTKEFALKTVGRLHAECVSKDTYSQEWDRCTETLKQVPEELFAQMNQGRTNRITHLVSIDTQDGDISRLFSARSCAVHEVVTPVYNY
jgi:hypothetical protein